MPALATATQHNMIRYDGFRDRDLDHLTGRAAGHGRGVEPITTTVAGVRAVFNNLVRHPTLQRCAGRAWLLTWSASHTIDTVTGDFAGFTFSSTTHTTINRVS